MADKGAITVVSKRPPLAPSAAAGGLLGADLGMIVSTLAQNYVPIAVILIPTLLGAGITALAAYVIQQRRGSLRRLNRDLLQINSMSERGLIDGDEYHNLKTRIIDDYRPQRVAASRIIKPTLWGALVSGSVLSLFIGAGYLALNGFFLGLFGFGAVGALLAAGGTTLAHQIQLHSQQRELPSGEPVGWQALGTRHSLPPSE
jgi:hypothetical protein